MSAFGIKPNFTNKEQYLKWMRIWWRVYERQSATILLAKDAVKLAQRRVSTMNALGPLTAEEKATRKAYVVQAGNLQKDLLLESSMARKLMMIRDEALLRRDRIIAMERDIRTQNQSFPLDLGLCKNIDIHYNRGHGEFPQLPMWVVRAKGRSFYVNEITCNVPWTTRERESGSTKGVLRISRAHLVLGVGGVAELKSTSLPSTTAIEEAA